MAKLTASEDRSSAIQRPALSHRIRSNDDAGGVRPFIRTDWLDKFLDDARLPTPGEQAANLIRFIGNEVAKTRKPMRQLPAYLWASIGSPNPAFASGIAQELHQGNLLAGSGKQMMTGYLILQVGLTLAGWERYEAATRGQTKGNYGFIALKFGDVKLDQFLRDVIKPCIRAGLGFDLLDMRDVSQAGVIDNIMRAQLQDAAFVLVDLTHDNSGAYWEAGYAEGLGKPVVYLCERAKFDEMKTHFDTIHGTTVLWSANEQGEFTKQLIATLRRSLNLFPTR